MSPGNVDDGSTVMDYLPQERKRGITINAAATTFGWRGYSLNLIGIFFYFQHLHFKDNFFSSIFLSVLIVFDSTRFSLNLFFHHCTK